MKKLTRLKCLSCLILALAAALSLTACSADTASGVFPELSQIVGEIIQTAEESSPVTREFFQTQEPEEQSAKPERPDVPQTPGEGQEGFPQTDEESAQPSSPPESSIAEDGSYTPKMKCSDSASKAIIPGKKMPWRLYDENGQAQCDLIAMDGEVIEAGKPVTMVNLDSDAIERTITFTPTAVRPLLVPHILGGKLAIELPSIAEKKAYIAKQLTEETWESELRLECPHKHYVNMTPAVAECRSRMYAELHGGKV